MAIFDTLSETDTAVKFFDHVTSTTLTVVWSDTEMDTVDEIYNLGSFMLAFHTKVLFICDTSKQFYVKGVPGFSTDIDSTVTFLNTVKSDYGIYSLVFSGCRVGGYAAALYGNLMSANIILTFNPITFLYSATAPANITSHQTYIDSLAIYNTLPTTDQERTDIATKDFTGTRFVNIHNINEYEKYHSEHIYVHEYVEVIKTKYAGATFIQAMKNDNNLVKYILQLSKQLAYELMKLAGLI